MRSVATFLLALAVASTPSVLADPHQHGGSLAHVRRFDKVLRSGAASGSSPAGEHHVEERRAAAGGVAVREGDETRRLVKRGGYSGRASYYAVGLGACGGTNSPSDYVVALNVAQYGDTSAVSSWCFKTITITYGGKSAQAQIVDACPGCPYGGLDMSQGLFEHFADTSVGIFYMSWTSGSSSPPKPTTTTSAWVAPTTTQRTTTSQWVAPTTTTTTSQWVPPTTTSQWIAPSSSPSSTTTTYTSEAPSSLTPSLNATMSGSLNSTLPSSALGNSTAPLSASPSSSSPSSTLGNTASVVEGGNLDALAQLVLGVGQLVSNAAANAAHAASS